MKEKNVQELRDEIWTKVHASILAYQEKLAKYETSLFNIQKLPKLPSERRPHFQELYQKVQKYLHNLKILDEELKNRKNLIEAEEIVILEISEKVLQEIIQFAKKLPDELKL